MARQKEIITIQKYDAPNNKMTNQLIAINEPRAANKLDPELYHLIKGKSCALHYAGLKITNLNQT